MSSGQRIRGSGRRLGGFFSGGFGVADFDADLFLQVGTIAQGDLGGGAIVHDLAVQLGEQRVLIGGATFGAAFSGFLGPIGFIEGDELGAFFSQEGDSVAVGFEIGLDVREAALSKRVYDDVMNSAVLTGSSPTRPSLASLAGCAR